MSGHVPPLRAVERYVHTMMELTKELGDVLGVPLVCFWSAQADKGPRGCTTA